MQQRPWKNSVCWLAFHGFLSYFPVEPRSTCPGTALSIVDRAFLHQLEIKKILYRPAHRPVWWKLFFG